MEGGPDAAEVVSALAIAAELAAPPRFSTPTTPFCADPKADMAAARAGAGTLGTAGTDEPPKVFEVFPLNNQGRDSKYL